MVSRQRSHFYLDTASPAAHKKRRALPGVVLNTVSADGIA
jgi:hypothetical protein